MAQPTIKKSTTIIANPWTKIIEEELVFQNGNSGNYLIVERNIALGIIPIFTKNDKLCTVLVKQYRHPIGTQVFQFPMGGLETGIDPKKHALEELRQETGLEMKKISILKEYYVDPGLSRQKCIVYLAEHLIKEGNQELEESENGMTVHFVPINQLEKMIENNQICDAWGITQVYLLLNHLKKCML